MKNFDCSFCSSTVDVLDSDSVLDGSGGLVCGYCMRRMGLYGGMFRKCELCRFPILSDECFIEGIVCHQGQCAEILIKLGMQGIE